MEGLRALPWLQEAREESPELLDCETCQDYTDARQRTLMGCGWLPRGDFEGRPPAAWCFNEGSEVAAICPGFTTQLPDLVDVATCYMHWDKGQLQLRLGGNDASPALIDGIELLHMSIAALGNSKRGR